MVGIIDYDMGNIQSVVNAFEYIGASVKVINNGKDFREADRIVLPGVGAFGVGMENLNKLNIIELLNLEVLKKKKPFLGICLGMQIICKESFEFGHFYGLGWIDASVRRFESNLGVRVPHVGWNNLIVKKGGRIMEGMDNKDMYFVHSYYVDTPDKNMVTAACEYGREFAAAVEKDNIFATQFHPEKSQNAGLNILRKFLEV